MFVVELQAVWHNLVEFVNPSSYVLQVRGRV